MKSKNLILIVVLFFFVTHFSFAQNQIREKELAKTYFLSGNHYDEEGDYDNAILYHKKALEIHERIYGEDSLLTADSHYNIGNAYFKKFDCASALSHHKKALSIYKAKEGFYHADTALIYNAVGLDYERNRNYDEALDCFRQALEISITVFGENHKTTANSYTNIGSIYEEWYEYEISLMYYQKALDIMKLVQGENDLDTAWSYHNVGNIFYEKENFKEALCYYKTAFDIRERLLGAEHIYILFSYYDMGNVYYSMGDYDRALGCYEKTLELRKKLDPNHVYLEYEQLSKVYHNKGDYDTALQYAEKVLNDRLKEFGTEHRYVADSYYNIATILCDKCNYKQALVYHKKALSIYIKEYGETSPLVADVYINMGVICADILDYGNALQYYNKALSINSHVFGEYSPQSALIYFNIAGIFCEIDSQLAVYYWKKTFKAYKNSSRYQKNISNLQSIIFYWIPMAARKPNDLPEALVAELNKEKMRLNIKEDLDTAFIRDTIALACDTVERARLDMSSIKSDILRKSLPLYYYGVDFEARHGNPAKAFEYAEMLRSRGFLDEIGLERAVSLDGVTDEERKQIKEFMSQIAFARKEIENQNNLGQKDRDIKKLTQAEKDLAAAEKSLAKLDASIGKRLPQYAQLRNPQTVSAKTAQKWCGNDRAILEYVFQNQEALSVADSEKDQKSELNSYCLVITKQCVTAVPLDCDFDYASTVAKLRENVIPRNARARPTPEPVFENERNSLYEKLIEPVLPYIKGKSKLLIVPDGSLSFLPFDILRKSENEKMLCERYAVSLSPSVSVSMIAGGSRVKDISMLAFGGAWYDSKLSVEEHRRTFSESDTSRGKKRGLQTISFDLNIENEAQKAFILQDIQDNGPSEYFMQKNLRWTDLPGTIAELNVLKDTIFKRKGYEQYIHEDAAEYMVKRLSKDGTLAKYPVLHFACHGYFDKTISAMSSILFSEVSGSLDDVSSDDGYLTIPEVSLLNLDADLVCLSACETGLGEIKFGDGMVGLNRAFMVAGARRVGVTLWSVDDEATAEFMASMYRKIERNGMDYEQAYRQTKAEFQKSEDYSHPYYWAAFALYE